MQQQGGTMDLAKQVFALPVLKRGLIQRHRKSIGIDALQTARPPQQMRLVIARQIADRGGQLIRLNQIANVYDDLLKTRGVVPNMFKTVANTPALALGFAALCCFAIIAGAFGLSRRTDLPISETADLRP